MAPASPAKSILKQPSQKPQPADDEAVAEAAQKRKNLEIALKHAYLIQHQRDTQAQILKSIEALLDFPPTTPPNATNVQDFLVLVAIFQPSDIDDLVEERRIDIKCGYPLCANKPRSHGLKESETWKLKKGAGDWCSNACARKGLFIKTQLSEVPAWERVPGQQPEINLHADDRHLVPNAKVKDLDAASRKVQQRVAERDELALERGERAVSFRPGQVMTDQIVEKASKPTPAQQMNKVAFASATAVERYEPGTAALNGKSDSGAPREVSNVLGSSEAESEPARSINGDAEDEEQQWRDMFAQLRTKE